MHLDVELVWHNNSFSHCDFRIEANNSIVPGSVQQVISRQTRKNPAALSGSSMNLIKNTKKKKTNQRISGHQAIHRPDVVNDFSAVDSANAQFTVDFRFEWQCG